MGGKIFPQISYLVMISQNHYKMTQMTYLRSSKNFRKVPIFMIKDYLPCQCKNPIQIHLH